MIKRLQAVWVWTASLPEMTRSLWRRFMSMQVEVSGGKVVINVRNVGVAAGGCLLILAVGLAWFGPMEDRTFYVQVNQGLGGDGEKSELAGSTVSDSVASLFSNSAKKMSEEKKMEESRQRKHVAIKYLAPQVIGTQSKGSKTIRSGAKLVGFLLNAIDTRTSSLVRVRIAKGGEVDGVEIERGSVLAGQYSYSGDGNRVFVSFSRIDTPDGEPKRIQAVALDSGSYTAGISGEVFSDAGLKTAASLGLTMLSGMADVMTEKESVGMSTDSVQAKSTMRNALLHGASRTAQEQTGRMQQEINNSKDYVVVPEGKEMIIELTEDYK